MPSSAAAYAPLAGADEQQPLAAAAVERDDAEAPDDAEAGAPRDTAADDSESEPEPSEAAEQPKEEEEEQEPAEDDADGTGGSVAAAAATRVEGCNTDEQLMGAIGSVEEAATLKRVEIPWDASVTADDRDTPRAQCT